MPTDKSKVFISHASEDKPFVRRLEAALEAAGVEVWVDHSDLHAGESFPKRIGEALASCEVLLLVWSQAAVASRWVEMEWSNALSLRKVIIPCVLDHTPLPPLLDSISYASFREFERGLAQLLQALRSIAPSQSPDKAEPPPPPDSGIRDRRIDAATPSTAEVGQRIDLLVQVRFPDSPLLGREEWPTKTKPDHIEQTSENIALQFPIDPRTGQLTSARLEIQIVAPDFEIAGSARQRMLVPPEEYSKCLAFLITPKQTGVCRINVEVYDLDQTFLGTIPLETNIGGVDAAQTLNVANLMLFVVVGHERTAPRAKLAGNEEVGSSKPPPASAPAPHQTTSGVNVNIGAGRDISIGGDVVGRDKTVIDSPANKVKKSWIESAQAKLTLVATLLGIILAVVGLKDSLFKTAPSSRFQTKVVDQDSNIGISGVTVRLMEIDGRQADQTVKTSTDGSFVLKVAAEAGTKIRLSFAHPEYQPYDYYYETENPEIIYLTRRAK